MAQPVAKTTRRGRTIVVWSLSMLAIGLAAGPFLAEHADQGLVVGIEWLAKMVPNFLRPYFPQPLAEGTPQPQGSSAARAISAAPSAAAPARTAPEPPAAASEVTTPPLGAMAPGVTAAIQPARRMEQTPTRKARASRGRTVALARAKSATPTPAAQAARRPRGEQSDPFDGDQTATKKTAAGERPAKIAAEPSAGKSKPAKSGDTLDDLMAGATSGRQPKDQRNSGKEIDSMLRDVQKSRPAPRPAHAPSESLPPLTASDIAKVMAGVKTGARACGNRLGQNGVADLRLTVEKDGKVTNVAVRGALAGLPVAECITQAVQGASFPPNSGLKFNYRIDIQ